MTTQPLTTIAGLTTQPLTTVVGLTTVTEVTTHRIRVSFVFLISKFLLLIYS